MIFPITYMQNAENVGGMIQESWLYSPLILTFTIFTVENF